MKLYVGNLSFQTSSEDLERLFAQAGTVVSASVVEDRETGRRRWTDQQFLYADFADAELGYAVTGHVAQGRTVRAGLAVLTGSEDRQHAYVALISRAFHAGRVSAALFGPVTDLVVIDCCP